MACGNPSITYAKDSITVNMGYNYVISSGDIQVENSSSEYEIISLDPSIAEVNGYIIMPKKKGQTTIRIQLVDNNSIRCDIKLTVTEIIFAEDIEVSNNLVYINMSKSNTAYNEILFNDGCNEVPELIYDNSVIDYDYLTGKITAKKLGDTVVVVLFRGCNVSFRVEVIDKIFAQSVLVEDCTIVHGYNGRLNFSVFPSNATTYNFFTMSDLLTLSSDGYYSTNGVGEALVFCEYTAGVGLPPTQKMFKVYIVDTIERFEMEIVKTNGQPTDKFLLEQLYRLRINVDDVISSNDIIWPNNIDIVTNPQTDNNGIYVDFYFKDSGDYSVKVDLSFDGKNASLSDSQMVSVKRISDVQIKAKWAAMIQNVGEDNKFHIYLTSDGLKPNNLYFIPVLNGVELVETLKVFDITNGDKEEVSQFFAPTAIGEYTFSFELFGIVVGNVSVVVEN